MERAWSIRDTIYIDKWFNSLSDTISDVDFYDRLIKISHVSKFCYGNLDLSEDYYWNLSKKEQDICKRNVVKVYHLYRNSCLFLKETSWDETLHIQEIFDVAIDLNEDQLKIIKLAIDSICLR